MAERRDCTGDSCRYSIEYSRRVVLVFLAVRSFAGCVFYANVAIVVFLLEYSSQVRKAEVVNLPWQGFPLYVAIHATKC